MTSAGKKKKNLIMASASETETNYMILKKYFYRPLKMTHLEVRRGSKSLFQNWAMTLRTGKNIGQN